MKVSPIKEYKTPRYAAKAAAMLVMTASASGCFGPVLSGAAAPRENATTTACETVPGIHETVISETNSEMSGEETECIGLEGDVPAISDTTTAASGIGSAVSAAFGKIRSLLGLDENKKPVLEGDVPMITEEEFILDGDVETPTEDVPDDYAFAEYYCDALYNALREMKGTLDLSEYDADYNVEKGEYSLPVHLTYEYDTDDDGSGYFPLDIAFVLKDSETWEKISGSSVWNKVNGGYVYDPVCDGETAAGTTHIVRKLLVVGVDDYFTELTDDFCDALVSDLTAKGVIE